MDRYPNSKLPQHPGRQWHRNGAHCIQWIQGSYSRSHQLLRSPPLVQDPVGPMGFCRSVPTIDQVQIWEDPVKFPSLWVGLGYNGGICSCLSPSFSLANSLLPLPLPSYVLSTLKCPAVGRQQTYCWNPLLHVLWCSDPVPYATGSGLRSVPYGTFYNNQDSCVDWVPAAG